MRYRLSNLRAPLDFKESELAALVARELRLSTTQISLAQLFKKSVDARRKSDVHFVLCVDFTLEEGARLPKHPNLTEHKTSAYLYRKATAQKRPLVVGFGPAGMLCALTLAEAGLQPLVIERGKDVVSRARDVEQFWLHGVLDPSSNVQFGEGGAGTFSDGKLTTGIKDPRCPEVLRVFHANGAPEEILYQSKPHIGTDQLPGMVKSIRQRIESLGGEVRFQSQLTQLLLDHGRVLGAILSDGTQIETDDIVLSIGHSAHDTLTMLHKLGIPMRKKPFSIGVRIEHPQSSINRVQYGAFAASPALGAADYKLAVRLSNGRGVYTFCMCPGGTVVAASSEPGQLVVNGMSSFARDGKNANSALLVSVEPADFPEDNPLAGLLFQAKWERIAYELGGKDHRAPAQLVGDFLRGLPSKGARGVFPSYRPGVRWTDLSRCLPTFATESLKQALLTFEHKLSGFASDDAVLTGIETRSSSPVTLLRNEVYMSPDAIGLYPCGEGAGHAGGIMSSAVDGMRCAESIIARYE